jgi:hypothetical protein
VTATVVLTLALATGATTAIFSVLDAVSDGNQDDDKCAESGTQHEGCDSTLPCSSSPSRRRP